MNIPVKTTFKVLAKNEPIVTKDGNKIYEVLVMTGDDCGKMRVSVDIYNAVAEGKAAEFEGVYTSFNKDGVVSNYISWKRASVK